MSDTSEYRNGALSKDRLLQTVGGVLLTVIGFLCAYCFYQIQGHDSRLARIETRQDGNEKTVDAIKATLEKINDKMDRIWQAIERRNP